MDISGTVGDFHGFEEMEQVTVEWRRLIALYSNRMIEDEIASDAAYFYNERPNISVLCSAAWSAGFIALEEYNCRKKFGRVDKHGRADLYINSGTSQFSIEAKQCYLPRSESKRKLSVVNAMKRARLDAANTPDYGCRLAVCFVVPTFRTNGKVAYKEKIEFQIDETIKEVIGICGLGSKTRRIADVVSWCFPYSCKLLTDEDEKNYWPGVFMAIRRIGRPLNKQPITA